MVNLNPELRGGNMDVNNPQSGLSQTPEALPGLAVSPWLESQLATRSVSYWIKKFFACNPFYLVSAALLLYGLSLVSSDAGFLRRELYQLAFNFSALQAYELLLVATAIILARRQIWYDSVLLIFLENLLVLAPFILISQASLLDQRLVWAICLAGGMSAMARYWGLKRFFKELNLPRRALICGFVLLLINFALPLIFHHLNELKIGTKPTEGAAYEMNRLCWLLLLPSMFALIHLLPRPRQLGGLLSQRAWLPSGMFLLWVAASGAYLFSLSYVYNFDWEPVFKAPLIWVVMWSVYVRQTDFVARPVPLLSRILLALPVGATLFALGGAAKAVFIALTIGNLACYPIVLMKHRGNRTALHLLLISGLALLAALWQPHASGSPGSVGEYHWLILPCRALPGRLDIALAQSQNWPAGSADRGHRESYVPAGRICGLFCAPIHDGISAPAQFALGRSIAFRRAGSARVRLCGLAASWTFPDPHGMGVSRCPWFTEWVDCCCWFVR